MSFDENTLYNIKTSLPGTRCPLFDLAIWKNGLAFKKIDFSEDGVPVIKIAELNNGIGSNTSFTEGDYGEEVRLHQGDLLFSWSGNPQTSIDVYKYQLDDGWLNQHIFKVTANETMVSKDFLFYLLKYLKPHFTQIATNKQTTGLGHVTIADLKRMSVVVPEKIIQDRIVAVVKTIDDKIEVNNEINKNLLEQAQMIYQSWFIRYDPFGGKLPDDWKHGTLGEIAAIKTESWSPAKHPNTIVEHYSIPAFDEKRYPVFESSSEIKSNKYILTPESVMISKLNPNTKRIWRPLCLSETPVCSTEFIVYEAKKESQRDFIFSIIDSVSFSNHLCAHVTGSTNSRQRAMPKTTLDFPVLIPTDDIITDFCNIVTPMYDLISSNIIENQSLAATRDSMLPKLMSGHLDISAFDF